MTQKSKSLETVLAYPDAKIMFLPTQDIHFNSVIEREVVYMNPDAISSTRNRNNSDLNPFEPFPSSSMYSFEQMGAMQKMRSLVNAVTITTKQVPIPKRKKKSWLRRTSNKKWNRKFTPQFIRVANGPKKVLSLSPALFEKLKELSKITKTTGPGALLGRVRG